MFEKMYPYTNYSEYNLDWIIAEIRKVHKDWSEFKILNTIRFEGLWDITKQYPAWSLVTDNNNVGYISVQPVPAGINVTNIDYWKEVYDYNAILPDIMNRIVILENAVDNIDNTEIPAIQHDVSTLQNDVTTLQGDVSLLKNRKILIFGDSYFMDNPVFSATDFRTFLTQFLTDTPNVEIDIKADGGEGFGQSDPYSFLYDVNNYTSTFDPDDVTDVFFVGGYNDNGYQPADILTGLASCVSAVKIKYPNSRISVGHFGWSGTLSSTTRDNIVSHSIEAYRKCGLYGCAYMANSEYTMHNYNLMYSDNFHPNEDGVRELAKQVFYYIRTGTCDVHYPYTTIPFNTDVTAVWTSSTYTVGYRLDNDVIQMFIPDGAIIYGSDRAGFNIGTGSYTGVLQIATLTDNYKGYAIGMYDGNNNLGYKLDIPGFFVCGSSTFLSFAECNFVLSGGFIQARWQGINASRNNFDSCNNVQRFAPSGTVVTIPTLMC